MHPLKRGLKLPHHYTCQWAPDVRQLGEAEGSIPGGSSGPSSSTGGCAGDAEEECRGNTGGGPAVERQGVAWDAEPGGVGTWVVMQSVVSAVMVIGDSPGVGWE